MASIVTGILNSTIGLLFSKLLDYTADKLKEGDLNYAQCRDIIVRELHDIKSKLDGLSGKDLLASLSLFKEGVNRLYISLETPGESCEKLSTSKASIENESEVEGATAATRVDQIPVMEAQRDVLKSAVELSEATASLNIASKERYKLAKESFKEAKKLATEAFNNVALTTEDRLTASKLRIASRILEGLDDPEAAVLDCFLYLTELQDLPAVQAMFSVWIESRKGFTSRLRARFNKNKRDDNMQSIQKINALLIYLVTKFTSIRMGLFNWPTIKIGKTFYHPLVDDPAVFEKLVEEKSQVRPWISKFTRSIEYPPRLALTIKGEILSRTARMDGLDITRRSGKCELFYEIPSENDENIRNKISCFAVDENDNVYILVKILSSHENVPTRYKLLTLDANGNVDTYRDLEDIDETQPSRGQMSVTTDGMIIMLMKEYIYIIDSTNARQVHKHRLPKFKDISHDIYPLSLTVSGKNEIIFTFCKDADCQPIYIYIITMDGKLKRPVKLVPAAATSHSTNWKEVSVVFNHVNETILVCVFSTRCYDSSSDSDDDYEFILMYIITMDGKLIREAKVPAVHHFAGFRKISIVFNHVNETILVSVFSARYNNNYNSTDTSFEKTAYTTIFSFSNTGELLHQFDLHGLYRQLISHPNGHVALIGYDKAFILQEKTTTIACKVAKKLQECGKNPEEGYSHMRKV